VHRHDTRFAAPLIVYVAVLGTTWIVRSRAPVRRVATACLGLAVVAATLGATFGAGGNVRILRAHDSSANPAFFGVPPRGQITLYANRGLTVSGPHRGPDLFALLDGLHDAGAVNLSWHTGETPTGDRTLEFQGVNVLAGFARLADDETTTLWPWTGRSIPVGFIRMPAAVTPRLRFLLGTGSARPPPRCVVLADGTFVWLALRKRAPVPGKPLPPNHFVCPLHGGR
jgi:hypothetical protein